MRQAELKPTLRQGSREGIRSHVLAVLHAQREAIATEAVMAVREQIPDYREAQDIDVEAAFEHRCVAGIDYFITCASEFRVPTEPELDLVRDMASRRQIQLYPLPAMLRAARIVQGVLWSRIVAEAGSALAGREVALELLGWLTKLTDASCTAVAEGHAIAQRLGSESASPVESEIIESLLTGRLLWTDRLLPAFIKRGFREDRTFAIAVASLDSPGTDARVDLVVEALRHHLMADRCIALVASRHEEIVVLAQVPDAVKAFTASVRRATQWLGNVHGISITAGIGMPAPGLDRVRLGYEDAHRALRVARRPRSGSVIDVSELSVFEYLLSQADATALRIVPEGMRRIAEDEGLAGTVLTFAQSGLNMHKAAETMAVHPNTIHYRLQRVAEITGRNPKAFADLVEIVAAITLLSGADGSGNDG